MAATDARPFPIKGAAYRVTFPIFDNDGDLVTGAAALDSEISKDGGTFADCTNEATEIATSSGMYYLDLTATEMSADTVSIIVKTTTTDAKTTPIVLYPDKTIVFGTVDDTGGTTTVFDTSITEATADHYNGRVLVWISGNLLGQACTINDYRLDTGKGEFTVSTLTEAPANGDAFLIY